MITGKRYYAGGKRITAEEHVAILNGLRDKLITCPSNHSGIPYGIFTEQIEEIDGYLSAEDPRLQAVLDRCGYSLEETYIIQIDHDGADPLDFQQAAAVYGYTDKGAS